MTRSSYLDEYKYLLTSHGSVEGVHRPRLVGDPRYALSTP
jgi:hypothetical protein